MTTEFKDLNLRYELAQALTALGYQTPTPIQAQMIPLMLTGQDVIGQAQTGTGKTAAFSLPILNNMAVNQGYVQCLVLAPTRELAMQVAKSMEAYGQKMNVSVLSIFGGDSYTRQIRRLKSGVDIVVGTPGRLLDLIQRKSLDLSYVSTVVLDEADEMLSMGFIADIESILEQTPASRQTALFSATMPREIRRLADRYMNKPQSITIEREHLTVSSIEQRYYLVNESDKMAALTRLFEVEPITSALIFARTRRGTTDLANELVARGFPAEVLNGDLDQSARTRVLDRFRENKIQVMVATDVAARGLDIDDISHVFNYDLPHDPEVYVHRVGRTGRAGKEGVAITLLTPKEQGRMRRIEKYTRQKAAQATLPTIEDIQQFRREQLKEKMEIWLRRGRYSRERDMVAEMVELGHDPLEIAAAALKLARAEEKQRPIAHVNEVRPERGKSKRSERRNRRDNGRGSSGFSTTSHEDGMVRLSLNTGRSDGIKVNHIVGTLARFANIPGHTIGKIKIQDQRTFVDVPEELAPQVLAKSGAYRIGSQNIQVAVA